jgi:uncharacterized lipoprotein YddW (UPF0748 family)
MSKEVLFSFLLVFVISNSFSQVNLKRELRGAWITTFFNIDWPIRGQSPQQQTNAFIDILNHYQAKGINTIYNSTLNFNNKLTASQYIVGVSGDGLQQHTKIIVL